MSSILNDLTAHESGALRGAGLRSAEALSAVAPWLRPSDGGVRGWADMRIGLKVFLVGAIPIVIAAGIALAAWMLLAEADRARHAAVLASTFYRNLGMAIAARDDYVDSVGEDRSRHHYVFASHANQAWTDMNALAAYASDAEQAKAITEGRDDLARFMRRMAEFVQTTERNDLAAKNMAARAASLISLSDQARARQHTSNSEIMASMREDDRKLRFAREIVDRTEQIRSALNALEVEAARAGGFTDTQQTQLNISSLRNEARDLAPLLRDAGQSALAVELPWLVDSYEERLRQNDQRAWAPRLSEWLERLLKVQRTQRQALHDEVASLMNYSVESSETDQATQNIAIEALKLGQTTEKALAGRDGPAMMTILEQSNALSRRVAALPISPLIQSEMVDAIDQWRQGLSAISGALKTQSQMIADMDASAHSMLERAGSLNDMFTTYADRIGDVVRKILVIGAAAALFLGAILAFYVARSITNPLGRLKGRMLELAQDPFAGPVADADRRDELGEIARAANFFVTEIGRREHALRRAKDRADTALTELRRTQDDLIQSEKLASLGQLVAGVAHEINTPVGIALTTATSMSDEVKRFGEAASEGRLRRTEFERFVARVNEGSQLLYTNLNRAAELVQSFKQVAVDQASGERRTFDLGHWLHELLTSLGPVLRKTKHEVTIECREGVVMDTYPGALAQVLTNLLMNAVIHAYAEGEAGRMVLRVEEPAEGWLRLTFTDDGRGIPPDHHDKIFEPFFTTGRAQGSTGLGLHIVYNLVTNSLLGRIDLESEPGKGTRFILDLPQSVASVLPQKHFATA
ncbi:sensor histidine kinase [Flaviflagellibacter deserti]|uniref:histidine kinase n=1 Tax=Flaviflagellibacter deserti TaxID=2267266 RepID=A0ABV9Z150_9HYPH